MKKLLTPLLLALCAATAQAAPFAITYSGTTASSTHPDVADGTPFSVTFIVDNGGTTAAGQQWDTSHLTCALWRIGSGAQRTTLTHPINDPITQLAYGGGAAVANAGGTALAFMFEAGAYAVPASDYTLDGPLGLGAPLTWNVNGATTPLADAQGSFDDVAGPGVPTDPALWGAPIAVTGACDDTPLNAPPPPPPPPGPHSVAPVPGLGLPALALLGMGAAGLGARRLRRR